MEIWPSSCHIGTFKYGRSHRMLAVEVIPSSNFYAARYQCSDSEGLNAACHSWTDNIYVDDKVYAKRTGPDHHTVCVDLPCSSSNTGVWNLLI